MLKHKAPIPAASCLKGFEAITVKSDWNCSIKMNNILQQLATLSNFSKLSSTNVTSRLVQFFG